MHVVWAGSKDTALRQKLIEWTSRQIWPDSKGKLLPDGVCLGVFDEDTIAGCVVYHDYEPDSGVIELSSAAVNKLWLTRPVLKAMFDYPFKDIGVQMVVTRVSARDGQAHLHRIFHAYGFKSLRIPRLFGRHEDGILFSLTDDDWRASKFNKGNC
jgi:RimJ/RimL family protein N-acetyltransferase